MICQKSLGKQQRWELICNFVQCYVELCSLQIRVLGIQTDATNEVPSL